MNESIGSAVIRGSRTDPGDHTVAHAFELALGGALLTAIVLGSGVLLTEAVRDLVWSSVGVIELILMAIALATVRTSGRRVLALVALGLTVLSLLAILVAKLAA